MFIIYKCEILDIFSAAVKQTSQFTTKIHLFVADDFFSSFFLFFWFLSYLVRRTVSTKFESSEHKMLEFKSYLFFVLFFREKHAPIEKIQTTTTTTVNHQSLYACIVFSILKYDVCVLCAVCTVLCRSKYSCMTHSNALQLILWRYSMMFCLNTKKSKKKQEEEAEMWDECSNCYKLTLVFFCFYFFSVFLFLTAYNISVNIVYIVSVDKRKSMQRFLCCSQQPLFWWTLWTNINAVWGEQFFSSSVCIWRRKKLIIFTKRQMKLSTRMHILLRKRGKNNSFYVTQ